MALQNLHNNLTKTATSCFDEKDVAFYSANIGENGNFNISIAISDKNEYLNHADEIDKDISNFILAIKKEIKKDD